MSHMLSDLKSIKLLAPCYLACQTKKKQKKNKTTHNASRTGSKCAYKTETKVECQVF